MNATNCKGGNTTHTTHCSAKTNVDCWLDPRLRDGLRFVPRVISRLSSCSLAYGISSLPIKSIPAFYGLSSRGCRPSRPFRYFSKYDFLVIEDPSMNTCRWYAHRVEGGGIFVDVGRGPDDLRHIIQKYLYGICLASGPFRLAETSSKTSEAPLSLLRIVSPRASETAGGVNPLSLLI